MKLIIAGSRDFTEYYPSDPNCPYCWGIAPCDCQRGEIAVRLDQLFDNERPEEVVCGMARGVDRLGKQWAESLDIPVTEFPADWAKHGKAAGMIRNKAMADYATHMIAFWDGTSRGTRHMIQEAIQNPHIIDFKVIKL